MAWRRTKNTKFLSVKQGFKNVGGGIWQAGKEYSRIPLRDARTDRAAAPTKGEMQTEEGVV